MILSYWETISFNIAVFTYTALNLNDLATLRHFLLYCSKSESAIFRSFSIHIFDTF